VLKRVKDARDEIISKLDGNPGQSCPFRDICEVRDFVVCLDRNIWHYKHLFDKKNPNDIDLNFLNSRNYDGEADSILTKDIENSATELLNMANVKHPPVPENLVYSLGRRRSIQIKYLPLGSCHGATWCFDNHWTIFINSRDEMSQQRFTLFHEAFHILMRNSTTYKPLVCINPAFRELLCDVFALYVLLPKEWVRTKWDECKNINLLKSEFLAPKQVILTQLKWLNLI